MTYPPAWECFNEVQLLCVDFAFQMAAEMVSSPHSSSDLCHLFMHPNTCYQTLLNEIITYICHWQLRKTKQIMRKCNLECWLVMALSRVHCCIGF
jgi:hypothetical protein